MHRRFRARRITVSTVQQPAFDQPGVGASDVTRGHIKKRYLMPERPMTRGAAIASASAFLALALGSVAFAAVPGADGNIKGCVAKTQGLLLGIPHSKGDTRLVEPNEACRNYEDAVTWNQQGQQGAPGVQGIQGIQGPGGDTGPAGPSGVTLYHAFGKPVPNPVGIFSLPADETPVTVSYLTLPAGTYDVRFHAVGQAVNGLGFIACGWGSDVNNYTTFTAGGYSGALESISIERILHVAAGNLETKCTSLTGYNAGNVRRVVMTAQPIAVNNAQ